MASLLHARLRGSQIDAAFPNDAGIPTLANMIILGKVIKETGVVSFEGMEDALKKVVSAKRADLFDLNVKAIEAGYNYVEEK